MSTFFLDYVNGNDANNGSSWALAWKTITLGALAARVAPGDLIKIAKTAAPTSLGINGAFTDGSKTITLSGSLTYMISDCDSAWTAAANITQADETYYYKEGSKSRKITPASLFGTGLMAYKATGTINLSAYNKISFWVMANGSFAANTLKVVLCSDVAGATIVNTATIPFAMQSYKWYPVTISTGALGAAIKSVALWAISDPGTNAVYLDNIIACTTLDLTTIVGKNAAGDPFMPIQSINGTTLRVGAPGDQGTSGYVYRGTTETVTLYSRETIKLGPTASYSTNVEVPNESGSVGNLVTFAGGYNTATGNQDGETWVDGLVGNGYAFNLSNLDYIKLDRIAAIRFYNALYVSDNATGCQLGTFEGSFGAQSGVNLYSNSPSATPTDHWTIDVLRAFGNSSYGLSAQYCDFLTVNTCHAPSNGYGFFANYCNDLTFSTVTCNWASNFGVYISSVYNLVGDTIVTNDCGNRGTYIQLSPGAQITNLTALRNAYNGLYLGDSSDCILRTLDIEDTGNYGITASGCINLKIIDLISSGNYAAAIWLSNSQIFLNNPLFDDDALIYFDDYNTSGISEFASVKKYNQTAGDNRIFNRQGTITSETTTRHTAAGFAWKMAPLIANQKMRLLPNSFKAAVLANKEVTIGVYVRKNGDYAGNAPRLVLAGNVLAGVTNDVTDALTVAADNWELLEVIGTPTEDGVLEFYVDCDGVAGAVFVDDFSIVQAA